MRTLPLMITLVALTALSGCTSQTSAPPPAVDPPVESTESSAPTSSPAPTTTNNPPPPPPSPEIAFADSLKWAASNDAPKTYAVKNGTTSLEVKIHVNATGPGAYSISGPGTPPAGKATVTLEGPDGEGRTVKEITSTSGVYGSGSKVVEDLPKFTIAAPKAGEWRVTIAGTGSNLQADVKVTALFA